MMEKYAAADTMWVLIGAFMVFFMQPGFCLLYTSGVDVDYEVLGETNGMLMVSVSGTAVKLD